MCFVNVNPFICASLDKYTLCAEILGQGANSLVAVATEKHTQKAFAVKVYCFFFFFDLVPRTELTPPPLQKGGDLFGQRRKGGGLRQKNKKGAVEGKEGGFLKREDWKIRLNFV